MNNDGKNALVMKMMPDDATWDPADIRYNVIRFVSSDLGYAIGAQAIAMLLSTFVVSQGTRSFPSEHAYLLVFGYCGSLSLVALILVLAAGRSTASSLKTAVL